MIRRFASLASNKKQPIYAGIILKRNPIVLRDPSDFEAAYSEYKRDNLLKTAAPYNADFFEAELRTGSSRTQSSSKEKVEDPVQYMERLEEIDADNGGDTRLDRQMTRSLYLAVKQRTDGKWRFPFAAVKSEESLVEVRFCALYQYVLYNSFSGSRKAHDGRIRSSLCPEPVVCGKCSCGFRKREWKSVLYEVSDILWSSSAKH